MTKNREEIVAVANEPAEIGIIDCENTVDSDVRHGRNREMEKRWEGKISYKKHGYSLETTFEFHVHVSMENGGEGCEVTGEKPEKYDKMEWMDICTEIEQFIMDDYKKHPSVWEPEY